MRSWQRLEATGGALTSLVGHSANVVQKDLVLLGGTPRLNDIHNSAHYTADVRTLCLDSGVSSSSTPQGGPRLSFHRAVPILKRKELLVFGGRQERLSNALYAYHVGTEAWREVNTYGQAPAARYGHSFTRVSEAAIMLFGGDVGQGPIDDLFFLTVGEKRWTRVQGAAGGPTPRAFHSATLVGDSVYVCGGTTISGLDNSLFAYKVSTKQWTRPAAKGVPPSPRYGHAAVAVGHLLVIIGGVSADGLEKDVHTYDTRTHVWTALGHLQLPQPVSYHSLTSHGKFVYCLSIEGCWKLPTEQLLGASAVDRSGVRQLQRQPTPTPGLPLAPGVQGQAGKVGAQALRQAIADLLILAKQNLDPASSKQQQVLDAIATLDNLASAPPDARPLPQRQMEAGRKPLTRSKELAAAKAPGHPMATGGGGSPPVRGPTAKSPDGKLQAAKAAAKGGPKEAGRPPPAGAGRGTAITKSPRGPPKRFAESPRPAREQGVLSPTPRPPRSTSPQPSGPGTALPPTPGTGGEPSKPLKAAPGVAPLLIPKKALPKPPKGNTRAGGSRRGPRPGVASMPNAKAGAAAQREVLSQMGGSRDLLATVSPRGARPQSPGPERPLATADRSEGTPTRQRAGQGHGPPGQPKPPLPRKPEAGARPAMPPRSAKPRSDGEEAEEEEEGEQKTFSCSGYVWKRKKKKNFLSSWKLRYFLLCNSVVYYYTTPHDTKPLGEFNIISTRVRRLTPDDISTHVKDKKPFCMELTTTDSTYHIATETKEDLDRWLSCLQEVMEQILISGEDSIVTTIAGPSESDLQLMKRSRPSMVLTSNITSKVKTGASRFPTLKAKRMQDFQITRDDDAPEAADDSPAAAPPPEATPESQLQAITQEIIETERDYVADLQIIINTYLRTLVDICGIRDSDKEAVFGNIEELLPLHTKLVSDLEKAESRGEAVGKIFHLYAAQFMLYAQYCASQASSKQVLQRLCDDNPNIGACLEETKAKPECKQLDLPSYLIKPMQRLCKYPLLLRELYKHLEEGSEAATLTESAIVKMGAVVTEVNESKRVVDNVIELAAIERSIIDKELALQQRGRAIVRKEQFKKVTVGTTTSKSTIWLFSDLLLIAKKKERDRFNFRCLANLADCIVWDLDPTGNAPAEKRNGFSVVQTGQSDKITVLASSQKEKSSWITTINDCIGEVSGGFM